MPSIDVVIRRVAPQERKVGGGVGAAVFRNPEAADGEAGDSAACRRPARGRSRRRTDRGAGPGRRRPAGRRCCRLRSRRVPRAARPVASSHSAAAMKSSNTFCLRSRMPARCQASPYSPPPRRFATAMRAARVEPQKVRRIEGRRQADVEAAVSGEQHRIAGLKACTTIRRASLGTLVVQTFRSAAVPAFGHEKHRDRRAVFRRIPHLLGRRSRAGSNGSARWRIGASASVAARHDRRRRRERRERRRTIAASVQRAPRPLMRADAGQRDLALVAAVERPGRQAAAGVAQRADQQPSVRNGGVDDRVARFRRRPLWHRPLVVQTFRSDGLPSLTSKRTIRPNGALGVGAKIQPTVAAVDEVPARR